MATFATGASLGSPLRLATNEEKQRLLDLVQQRQEAEGRLDRSPSARDVVANHRRNQGAG